MSELRERMVKARLQWVGEDPPEKPGQTGDPELKAHPETMDSQDETGWLAGWARMEPKEKLEMQDISGNGETTGNLEAQVYLATTVKIARS